METEMKTTDSVRYDYIDYLRGIAAIFIILIHTSFWSGTKYIPAQFYNLTLIVDVPFFFYLSGWGSNYTILSVRRVLVKLFKMWIKWAFFVSIVMIS